MFGTQEGPGEKAGSDLEVPAKAKRRRVTAACKLRVLEEADALIPTSSSSSIWGAVKQSL